MAALCIALLTYLFSLASHPDPRYNSPMSAVIKQTLATLPQSSGIYQMISTGGDILYIGKAKNLQKRVTYYTKPDLPERLRLMTSLTHRLEHVITKSETEALLLEARLIKKHQPKFNILLKDDKSFPYIRFRADHDFPQILKYRGKAPPAGRFFGPFSSSEDVDVTLKELQKIFKLRPCSDNYFASRTRPCLQYQINRCSAPCVGKINKEDYAKLASQGMNFLSGKTKELQEELAKEMEVCSTEMSYEKAAEVRDRIKALSYVQLKFGKVQDILRDADVIRLEAEHGAYVVLVALYRNGQYYGSKPYFPVHTEGASDAEVMEAFILQFYLDKVCPDELILSHDVIDKEEAENMLTALGLDADASSNSRDHKRPASEGNRVIKITVPTRGAKLQLLQSFEHPAKLALENHLKSHIKKKNILESLRTLFDLPSPLDRIEIYDNSHISGQHAVGAMVVAGSEGFLPKEYRCYNVLSTSLAGGDDYAMLRQVLTRRLEKIAKNLGSVPSLMIIDGGKGHMSTVLSVMEKTKITIPFVCMSKGEDRNAGREQFHMPGRETFTMPHGDKVMHYLQVLRDEAHNYAIRKHRLKRSKSMRTSSLDEIEGVGARRKKDLLQQFGSVGHIKNASEEELAAVSSIGKSTARKIFTALHQDVY